MQNHFDLLNIKKYKAGSNPTALDKMLFQIANTKHRVYIYKVLEYAGIDGIGKESAFRLFKNRNTFEEILTPDVTKNLELLNYGKSLFEIITKFNAIYVEVMMTNSIAGYSKRSNFIDHMNREYGDIYHFKEVGKVSRAQALIADRLTGTSKESYAIQQGIPIMNSSEFETTMKFRFLEKGGRL